MSTHRRRHAGIAGILVFLGLLASGGTAEAHPYNFNMTAAWWDTLNCARMNVAINAYEPALNATGSASGYCVKYKDLMPRQKWYVNQAAMTISGSYDSIHLWWEALDCRKMTIATGYGNKRLCGHFAGAPKTTPANVMNMWQEDVVAVVGYALATGKKSTAAAIRMTPLWMPFTAVPALPIVGVGILGLLLAGRGAWLRRRAARASLD